MNDNCIQCGIPFVLHEQGFLYVQTEADLSSFSFEKQLGTWWNLEYKGLSALSAVVVEVLNQTAPNQSIRGALTKNESIPSLSIPLSELNVQIHNPDTITLIQKGELISFLQPIIHLQDDSNSIYGYESLLRASGDSFISPGHLFSTAANAGMLSLLDQRAREAAIKAKHQHVKNGLKSFINFLPSTIYNPEFCLRHTFQLVKKYDIQPEDLVFEVVESEKINDIGHLKKVLSTYKREGMKVALDDVGSGFATLEVLKNLNPDYVKIDRHYIDHCDSDHEKQNFLADVIHIAKDLGIIVLAEGIERKEELEYCKHIGVNLAQGYYIGKPASAPQQLIYQ